MAIGGTGARHTPTAAPPPMPAATRQTSPPPETAFAIPASNPRAALRLYSTPRAALAAADSPAIFVEAEAAVAPAVAHGETVTGTVCAIGKSTEAAPTSERRGAASATAPTMTATTGNATRATNATHEISESSATYETYETSATSATSAISRELGAQPRPHCAHARPPPSEEIFAMQETDETRP